MIPTVTQLAELAKESSNCHDDWNRLKITKDHAYKIMAAHVLEIFNGEEFDDQKMIMMAVVTDLLVENFLLNLKLSQDNS